MPPVHAPLSDAMAPSTNTKFPHSVAYPSPVESKQPISAAGAATAPVANNTPGVHRESVIIFDWDDTLLASSFLSSRGLRLDTDRSRFADLEPALRDLEQSIITIISLALQFGEVHVVTNAETGWVQLSAQKFIPAVVPILSRVTILSARSTYESRFPDSPLKWKYYAFQDKLAPHFAEPRKHKNILSFGDSHVEREAVRAVTRGFPNTRCKSVKFAERPSMEQLRRQIELVTNCFQYIHHHEGDLDLQLTVTVHSQNPSASSTPQQQQVQQQVLQHPNSVTQALMATTEEKPAF